LSRSAAVCTLSSGVQPLLTSVFTEMKAVFAVLMCAPLAATKLARRSCQLRRSRIENGCPNSSMHGDDVTTNFLNSTWSRKSPALTPEAWNCATVAPRFVVFQTSWKSTVATFVRMPAA
jgi:hypothetical protein